MANVIYPLAKQAFLEGNIDLLDDDIIVILVDTDEYTYSASHEFLDDIPAEARVEVSDPLTNKTTTSGVFDADDISFVSVEGAESEALIFVQDTNVEGTSRLIAYFDNATGLPFQPNSGPLNITWNASGIFAI